MSDNDDNTKSDATKDIEKDGVGYGTPPKNGQFVPGQSGNLRGRPKGARNRKKIVEEISSEMHRVKEGDRVVRRSTLELVLMKLRNAALTANLKAEQAYHSLLKTFDPQEPDGRYGYIIMPEEEEKEEWSRKTIAQQKELKERARKFAEGRDDY